MNLQHYILLFIRKRVKSRKDTHQSIERKQDQFNVDVGDFRGSDVLIVGSPKDRTMDVRSMSSGERAQCTWKEFKEMD